MTVWSNTQTTFHTIWLITELNDSSAVATYLQRNVAFLHPQNKRNPVCVMQYASLRQTYPVSTEKQQHEERCHTHRHLRKKTKKQSTHFHSSYLCIYTHPFWCLLSHPMSASGPKATAVTYFIMFWLITTLNAPLIKHIRLLKLPNFQVATIRMVSRHLNLTWT